MNFQEKVSHLLDWEMDAGLYSSLLCMLVILILTIVVGVKASRANPLEKPKGVLLLAEWGYEKVEGFVKNNMGPGFENFTGFFMCLISYLFLAFNWGLFGMPSIIDWLGGSLSVALITFILVHVTAIRYQKWRYFKRYVDPFPVFLPMNLISMWSPLLSTTMRMFGNCLSGTIVIGLVQWFLQNVSGSIMAWTGLSTSVAPLGTLIFHPELASQYTTAPGAANIWLAAIPMGILNLYFSLFSAYIQTTVFSYLTALWISAEKPEELDVPGQEGVLLAQLQK